MYDYYLFVEMLRIKLDDVPEMLKELKVGIINLPMSLHICA